MMRWAQKLPQLTFWTKCPGCGSPGRLPVWESEYDFIASMTNDHGCCRNVVDRCWWIILSNKGLFCSWIMQMPPMRTHGEGLGNIWDLYFNDTETQRAEQFLETWEAYIEKTTLLHSHGQPESLKGIFSVQNIVKNHDLEMPFTSNIFWSLTF